MATLPTPTWPRETPHPHDDKSGPDCAQRTTLRWTQAARAAELTGCSDAVPGPPPPLQNRRSPSASSRQQLRRGSAPARRRSRTPPPGPLPHAAGTYLWGVTFCSILTSGNRRRRRSAARSPGGLGSPHRRAQHNPGRGGAAAARGPPDGGRAAGRRERGLLRRPPHDSGSLARSAGGGSRKMAAASAGRRAAASAVCRARPCPVLDSAVNSARRRSAGVPASCPGRRGQPKPRKISDGGGWTPRGFRGPPPPSLNPLEGGVEGWTDSEDWAGPERGAAGAPMGSALPAGAGRGRRRSPFPGGWTWIARAAPGGSVGRQAPPARPRGRSTPARNGAAEPRASALYIAGGAELRCSCAPPCSRLPPPLCACSLAHAREEAKPGRQARLFAGAFPIGPLRG